LSYSIQTSLGLISVLTLTACMGTGPTIEQETLVDISTDVAGFVQRNDTLSAASVVPISGQATYNGVAAYSMTTSSPQGILNTPEQLSDVMFSIDFESGVVEGAATDFRRRDGSQLAGGFELTNGSITDDRIVAAASGSMTLGGRVVDVEGDVTGALLGVSGENIVGTGTLESTDGDAVFSSFSADATQFAVPETQTTTARVATSGSVSIPGRSIVSSTQTSTNTNTINFQISQRTTLYQFTTQQLRLIELERNRIDQNTTCYTGPRGGTYTLTASGNKNYNGC